VKVKNAARGASDPGGAGQRGIRSPWRAALISPLQKPSLAFATIGCKTGFRHYLPVPDISPFFKGLLYSISLFKNRENPHPLTGIESGLFFDHQDWFIP